MITIFRNIAMSIACVFSLAAQSGEQFGVTERTKWADPRIEFFFRNSSDTTNFWHAFDEVTKYWNIANVNVRLTGGVRPGNTACQPRSRGIPVTNWAFHYKDFCGNNFSPETYAIAYMFYDDQTHLITRADIVFNTAWIWGIYNGPWYDGLYSNRPDFKRVAAHEIGHAIGLTHSTSTSDIMYPNPSNIERPSPNDIGRVINRYISIGTAFSNKRR